MIREFYQRYRKSLPILLLVMVVPLSWWILTSDSLDKPRARNHEGQTLRIVNVRPIKKGDYLPIWQASGEVSPAEQVKVVAEVSGIISELGPKANPGQLVEAGDWLVKLDQRELQLQLLGQQAQLVQAQANLELEQANQELARQEYELVKDSIQATDKLNTALVLKEPQVATAKARVAAAQANLDKAQLNLERAIIKAPFRGVITSRLVGRGSKVNLSSGLFELVNTDTFWLEVKVPRAFLSQLDTETEVIIRHEGVWPSGVQRQARVFSVLPDMDSRDRQAKILLTIEDPLSLIDSSQPRVFVNDFLTVDLPGQLLANSWMIEPAWLMPQQFVWVVDSNNLLYKREVKLLFKGRKRFYVEGDFQPGDRALAEKMDIATQGMEVKPRQQSKSKRKSKGERS
ncbi:MAG: efflux RND transporter periplasmic adaptor subunit [Pseudomonadales bacterium]